MRQHVRLVRAPEDFALCGLLVDRSAEDVAGFDVLADDRKLHASKARSTMLANPGPRPLLPQPDGRFSLSPLLVLRGRCL
eukprot:3227893-Prymnesium_polylepis.2